MGFFFVFDIQADICVYKGGEVNMISAGFCNKKICYGNVYCHDTGKRRRYEASVACEALKGDTCPEATACFLSEDEVTVKNVADNSDICWDCLRDLRKTLKFPPAPLPVERARRVIPSTGSQ